MFSFLKGQANNKKQEKNGAEEEREKIKAQARINEEIVIHTMPEIFHSNGAKGDEAKTMGVFIMIAGFVFIIIAAGFDGVRRENGASLLLDHVLEEDGREKTQETESEADEPPAEDWDVPAFLRKRKK